MKRYIPFTGDATYMYPSGELATPDRIFQDFPASCVFPHVILTDEREQMCWAVQNLAGLRELNNIDPAHCDETAIAMLTEIENRVPEPVESPVSDQERIAAALEFLVMTTLYDDIGGEIV